LDVTDDRVDDDPVVAQPALRPRGDGQSEQPRELGRVLGVAQVGRDDDAVVEVLLAEVVGSTPRAVRWSTGTEKKPCTWGACRFIVSTRSAPAVEIRSATRRPPSEMREASFLSLRA
jgi:hypothetical protein